MTLMSARPWKHPKTGVYWYRRRIPADLVDAIGRGEEKFSLRTKDPAEAKRLHAEALAASERRWQGLRLKERPLEQEEVIELARSVHDQCLKTPSLLGHWNMALGASLFSKLELPAAAGPVEMALSGANDFFARLPMEETCRSLAAQIKRQRGVVTTDESNDRLLLAIAAAAQAAAKQLGSRPFEQVAWSVPRSSRQVAQKPVSFEVLLEGWAAEAKPTDKTRYMWGRVLDQLASFLGHSDAARTTSDDLVRWKAQLLAQGLSPRTIKDGKLAPVAAMFAWALRDRKIQANPAADVDLTVKQKPGQGRRGYSDEEASLILRTAKSERGVLKWLPWLCAFTGARISELCQLRRSDLVQLGSVWCIKLVPEAGSLKNVGSERTVPLHPALIAEGFVQFVHSGKTTFVFPELVPDRFGSRGGSGTKLVGRWIRGLGLDDPRLAPSHSWRHRLKTLARRHGLAPDAVDAITGHARKTVGDQYGEYEVEGLLRELSKIPSGS